MGNPTLLIEIQTVLLVTVNSSHRKEQIMWNGQATTALKEWAEKEANKIRVEENKKRIEQYSKGTK
jgi:hypothetical protein